MIADIPYVTDSEIKATYTMYTILAVLTTRKIYTSLRFFLYYGFKP